MKEPMAIIIGIFLIFLLFRLFFKPLRLIFRLGMNSLVGLAVLIGYSLIPNLGGMTVGINLFSVLMTGFLGLPGGVLLLLLGKFL